MIVGALLALSVAACDQSEEINNFNEYSELNSLTLDDEMNVLTVPTIEDPVPQRYAINDAARLGLIEYDVIGRGASSGPALQLQLRRTTAEPIQVYIPQGTVFETGSQGVQSMVARSILREIAEAAAEEIIEAAIDESGVVELVDDAVHNFLVDAYCLDFELDNPSPQNSFTASQVDARAAALLEAATVQRLSVRATQVALWMDRDRVTPETISEVFAFSAEELEAATRLLAQLPPR